MSDVIIAGSGPAGMHAARELVRRGKSILILEAGPEMPAAGADLPQQFTTSHKLDLPGFRAGHALYKALYPARTENFTLLGQLGPGGLSRFWGTGCTVFTASDWGHVLSPFDFDTIEAELSAHIGVTGRHDGPLDAEFGPDMVLNTPTPVPGPLGHLLETALFDIPRLAQSNGPYDASTEREALLQSGLCRFEYNAPVLRFAESETSVTVDCGNGQSYTGTALCLAAGTIGSMTITARSLNIFDPMPFQHTPNAFFLALSARPIKATEPTDLSQLAGLMTVEDDMPCYLSVYAARHLPDAYFIKRLPLPALLAKPIWSVLKPHALIVSLFLPGSFGPATLHVHDSRIDIASTADTAKIKTTFAQAFQKLAKTLMTKAILEVPFSLVIPPLGSDMHYACGLPMARMPVRGQCDPKGRLSGTKNVFCVDGASLPKLPAKAHSFAIMMNAIRIARALQA